MRLKNIKHVDVVKTLDLEFLYTNQAEKMSLLLHQVGNYS